MYILLSNDDGYQAPGLVSLYRALSTISDVDVVAPERNRSGSSNSLTLATDLVVKQADNGFYYVNGTPADCVHLAITHFLDRKPDMIIAGVNSGANLGDDVLYSGTVGAAMEGRFLEAPAIAVSLVGAGRGHYDSASNFVLRLIPQLLASPLSNDLILNINVPDLPEDEIKGQWATRLGKRLYAQPAEKQISASGQPTYRVGATGRAADEEEHTDFYAVKHGYISVTPLLTDLTHYSDLSNLSDWMRDAD
jgi:5'-nucleotidase